MLFKKYLSLVWVIILFSFTNSEEGLDGLWKKCMDNLGRGNIDLAMGQLDSLYELAKERRDTIHLTNYYETAGEMAYYNRNYEQCLWYSKANLALNQNSRNYAILSLVHARIGNLQRHFGNVDSAFNYTYRAKALLSKIDHSKNDKPIVYIYNDLAMLHSETSQVDSSIYYYLKLLNITPPTDSFRLQTINLNLSGVFKLLNNTEKQAYYLDRAFNYCKSDKLIGSRTGIMGIQAAFYRDQGNYRLAKKIIDEAIDLQLKHNKPLKLVDNYLTKSSILIKMNLYQEAEEILNSIGEVADSKNKEVATSYFLNKLILAINTRKSENIPQLISITNSLVKELNFLHPQKEFYAITAKYYKEIGNFKIANQMLEKFIVVNDSLTNLESIQIAKNLESEFEFEKNNLRIETLEKQEVLSQKDLARQRYLLIGGGLTLALISLLSFFLFGQNNKIKKQKGIIEKSLSEKDTLLREIHHRVKNNLQLVSSLLTLQSRSITDKSAIAAINDGKARVRSMALIHQNLYNRENLTGISVKQYIQKLCSEIFNTYNILEERITLELDIQELELDVDTVVPLGLIINELLTNSLKYAFPNNQSGWIRIKLNEIEGKLDFELKDNGVGMEKEHFEESSSFGNRLIKILTEQLDGELSLNLEKGTQVNILIDQSNLAA